MATEFNDAEHYGIFTTAASLTSQTGKMVRQSELVLASLRAQGVLDTLVDSTAAPAHDKLWLDKNSDPAVLKEWDSISSTWQVMTFDRLFGRAVITEFTNVGGTANAITVDEPATFMDNRIYGLVPTTSNTGAATVQVTGVGTYDVVYPNGDDIVSGELVAGFRTPLLFTSGRFEVVFGANAGSVKRAETDASGFSFTVDEDDMASDSATLLPTQQSVKAYVDAKAAFVNVVADHRAAADSQTVAATVSITSGTAVLAATGASFTADDVGKSICVPGAGATGAMLFTTISAVGGPGSATLADNAGTTLSSVSKTLRYWSDQTAKFQAAVDAAVAAGGGVVFIPAGEYGFDASTPLDPGVGNVIFMGEGSKSILRYYEGTAASKRYLFKNTDTTVGGAAKGDLGFKDFAVKGTLDLSERRAGNPFWLDHYEDVFGENITEDQIAGEAMDFHFLRSFRWSSPVMTNIAADGVRCRDTPNAQALDGVFVRIGDDAVALHTADTSVGSWPTREGITVRGNHLTVAGAVSIEGARKVSISDNHWKFATQGGCIRCIVLPAFTEGDVPNRDIDIEGNTCENLLQVTSATPTTLGQFILIQGTTPRGATSTNGTIPGDYDGTGGTFIYPWDYDDVLTTDTDNPVPRVAGVRIHGNRCRRTAPNATNFSDYGFGTAIFQGASYDPEIDDSDFRQAVGVLVSSGGLHGASIANNHMEYFQKGYTFAAPANDRSYRSVLVGGNIARDFTVNGFLVNDAACSADILFDGNVLDGDIYRAAGNSNIDGTYDADGNPVGYELNGVQGIRIRGGSIANVCQPVHSTGGAVAEGVTLISALPAAIGFSGSNKGIGNAPRAGDGYRYWIVDADPTSATYRDHVTLQALEASVMPSTGSYVAGAFVKNSNPTAALGILGWVRLTTGTGHTEGTDWLAVYATRMGTYTPTLTGVTNVDSTTAAVCHYQRTGNQVTVWGFFQADFTAGGAAASEIGISLPVSSTFTLATDASGVANSEGQNYGARIQADTSNNRLKALVPSAVTGNINFNFVSHYEVK